jgi:hypothetical protein
MSVPMPVSQQTPLADSLTVRLDVRFGTGKLTTFTVDNSEFLVGGSTGCDFRLPGSNVPALIGVIRKRFSEILFERSDPAFPVLLNGRMLLVNAPESLRHGDRLAIGSADVTIVVGSSHLRPAFYPVEAFPAQQVAKADPLADEKAELEKLRAELGEQARELEADRVLWYHRRREIEAELDHLRASASQSAEQQDLNRVRQELATIRQQLFDEYQKRRDELVEMQGVVRGASEGLQQREKILQEAEQQFQLRLQSAVQERLDRLEKEYAERRQQLETEHSLRIPPPVPEAELTRREEQLNRGEEEHKADLLRLERWQARLEEQQRDFDHRATEIDQRHQQLMRDSRDWEEQLRLAQAEQTRQVSEAARLNQQRADAEKLAEQLAERAAQLDAQQASLAVIRARLDRQHREAEEEANRLREDRERVQSAQHDLDGKLQDAEKLRAELALLQQGTTQQSTVVEERTRLLQATLAELEQQNTSLTEREARLTERESALDARSIELAEQTATLTARVTQVMELQQRLEADRDLLRNRELNLSESDTARQTFQEQLRRRSEELSARSKHLDEMALRLTTEKAELDRAHSEWQETQTLRDAEQKQREITLAERVSTLEKQSRELSDREANLARQVARLREVGRNVAAARRELHDEKEHWAKERLTLDSTQTEHRDALAGLQAQLPTLQEQSQRVLEQLNNGRERLRGHLTELHRFANHTREELETQRALVRAEAEQLQERERQLDTARAEHRLAITEFRQQVLDWQTKLSDIRSTVNRSESQLASKQAEVSAAAQIAERAAIEIAQEKEELRQERMRVSERRAEVERQLSEMREWYRRKLRDLAKSRTAVEPVSSLPFRAEELDPGDRQLGELLLRLELVDSESLATLWQQAQNQRRTLRHVLLVSGVVTLYQLALIESGNLDGLMLGRFRVIDRVSHSPAENIYRVYDPTRSTEPNRGIYLLRWLAEAEMEDPVHPDEYTQRFTIMSTLQHKHLHTTLEVLSIQQRPAVLQEWLSGLPSSDWPAEVTTPGVWLRLLKETASALAATHSVEFAHGRLTTGSLLLTVENGIKLLGAGEPDWLYGEPQDPAASVERDLRALGQLAYLWLGSAQAQPKKRTRGKSFPDTLQAVIRRLDANPETPMADTVAGAMPYSSAQELVDDLTRLSQVFPCPQDAWESLIRQVSDNVETPVAPLRRSA